MPPTSELREFATGNSLPKMPERCPSTSSGGDADQHTVAVRVTGGCSQDSPASDHTQHTNPYNRPVRTGPVVVVMLTHRDPPLVQRLVDRVPRRRRCRGRRPPRPARPRAASCGRPPGPPGRRPGRRPAGGGSGWPAAVLTGPDAPRRRRCPELSWALVVSGQDYPSRPMASIEQELRATDQDAFLRWFPIGDPADDVIAWQARCRRRYLHSRRLPGSVRHVPLPAAAPVPRRARPVRRRHVAEPVGRRPGPRACPARRLPEVERYLATCQVPDEALAADAAAERPRRRCGCPTTAGGSSDGRRAPPTRRR